MAIQVEIPALQAQTSSRSFIVPESGCYVPAITFYSAHSDTLDLDAQAKYFKYLATTGLKGLVVLGTNAETFLLTKEERKALLILARQTCSSTTIIAGVSGHSTAQVLEYIIDAYDAGSDYVLLLPCAYFGKQTTPAVVESFFHTVAKQSPLPIILYNFPAVCNGLDMDSELIAKIAQANPAVVGVKLTCGSVAKIARLAATFPASRFATFGGQSDFLLGGLAVGSAGCIAAFANIYPRSVARLYELWRVGRQEEAYELQQKLALAESPTKAGIANTKYGAAVMTAPRAGIENADVLLRPRHPYVAPNEDAKAHIRAVMQKISYLEDQKSVGDTRLPIMSCHS